MSGALSPHCVFDKVIPQVNSSNKVRIPGEYCVPEHATGGAAVGDYDGDGMEDIYFTVFHDRSVLYKNNGKWASDRSPNVKESKWVLDSGFHAVDSRFQPLNSCKFFVSLGFRIPIVRGVSASLSCIPAFSNSGIRIPLN